LLQLSPGQDGETAQAKIKRALSAAPEVRMRGRVIQE
jgi:hypothetical protein